MSSNNINNCKLISSELTIVPSSQNFQFTVTLTYICVDQTKLQCKPREKKLFKSYMTCIFQEVYNFFQQPNTSGRNP